MARSISARHAGRTTLGRQWDPCRNDLGLAELMFLRSPRARIWTTMPTTELSTCLSRLRPLLANLGPSLSPFRPKLAVVGRTLDPIWPRHWPSWASMVHIRRQTLPKLCQHWPTAGELRGRHGSNLVPDPAKVSKVGPARGRAARRLPKPGHLCPTSAAGVAQGRPKLGGVRLSSGLGSGKVSRIAAGLPAARLFPTSAHVLPIFLLGGAFGKLPGSLRCCFSARVRSARTSEEAQESRIPPKRVAFRRGPGVF